MFEQDLKAASWNDTDVPAIFYEIAEAAGDVSPIDVRDAVLAAFAACPDDASPAERRQTYQKLLRHIASDYAAASGLSIETVCDALVGAAQASEPIKEELQRRRRTL